MLHRSNDVSTQRERQQRDDSVNRLLSSLRDGVLALRDPEVEAKVQAYFERHPNYSCDLIHVAAVACGFQAAKQRAAALTRTTQTARAVSLLI